MTLIVAALTAGAQSTATEVVKDAYARLKDLVRRRFAGRPSGETALEEHEQRPEVWQKPLETELVAADAGRDEGLVEAAQRLLAIVDPEGARAGRYVVDARGSQGVQIGDHGTQTNTFGTPPPP